MADPARPALARTLAVLFWRHGAPALCAATLILAAEVTRQTVAAVRRWPC